MKKKKKQNSSRLVLQAELCKTSEEGEAFWGWGCMWAVGCRCEEGPLPPLCFGCDAAGCSGCALQLLSTDSQVLHTAWLLCVQPVWAAGSKIESRCKKPLEGLLLITVTSSPQQRLNSWMDLFSYVNAFSINTYFVEETKKYLWGWCVLLLIDGSPLVSRLVVTQVSCEQGHQRMTFHNPNIPKSQHPAPRARSAHWYNETRMWFLNLAKSESQRKYPTATDLLGENFPPYCKSEVTSSHV